MLTAKDKKINKIIKALVLTCEYANGQTGICDDVKCPLLQCDKEGNNFCVVEDGEKAVKKWLNKDGEE